MRDVAQQKTQEHHEAKDLKGLSNISIIMGNTISEKQIEPEICSLHDICLKHFETNLCSSHQILSIVWIQYLISLSKHAFSFPCQVSFSASETLITKLTHHHHSSSLICSALEKPTSQTVKTKAERRVYEKGKRYDFRNIATFQSMFLFHFLSHWFLYTL